MTLTEMVSTEPQTQAKAPEETTRTREPKSGVSACAALGGGRGAEAKDRPPPLVTHALLGTAPHCRPRSPGRPAPEPPAARPQLRAPFLMTSF